MALKKVHDRVYMEAVLRMYDAGGRILNGIKCMYVHNLACIRVKSGESECFRIDTRVRQGCIMSPWLFNEYMDAVKKEVKMGMRGWVRDFWSRGEDSDYLASCM